jgi:hypothetical protein
MVKSYGFKLYFNVFLLFLFYLAIPSFVSAASYLQLHYLNLIIGSNSISTNQPDSITALVTDALGNGVSNVIVNFSTDFGTLTQSRGTTNSSGETTTFFSSSQPGVAKINGSITFLKVSLTNSTTISVCQRAKCSSNECGSGISDGCGGTLNCGSCIGNSFDLCGGAGVVQNVNINGTPFNVSDFSSAANINYSNTQNCNVFLNASNNNITIQNLNVNGTLLITGDNINIFGNINATNIITVSNSTSSCLNFNGFINSFGYAEFEGQNPECGSYFNGTLVVNTTSALLLYNGSNYSILFNFSGPLTFSGAVVNSTNPPGVATVVYAPMAVQALSVNVIKSSSFNLLSTFNSVFNASSPIIVSSSTVNTGYTNFYPCFYSPDSTFSALGQGCILIYLYGRLYAGNMGLSSGSLFVNGVFDSNGSSLTNTWYSGLTQEYDNVINSNGFLNVSIYIPTINLNTAVRPYVGVQFSASAFKSSTGGVQYYIPVIKTS